MRRTRKNMKFGICFSIYMKSDVDQEIPWQDGRSQDFQAHADF
jgi:hypothetical protein